MMPSRTNLAAGIPSSKVKYSKLSSTDEGYIDLQVKGKSRGGRLFFLCAKNMGQFRVLFLCQG